MASDNPDANLGISAYYYDWRICQRAKQHRVYSPEFQIPCPNKRAVNK